MTINKLLSLMLLLMATMSFTACGGDSDEDTSGSVTSVLVRSVSVTGSKKQLEIGESLQLSATISPSDASNKSVSWSSSNASVAKVSSSGLVEAVNAGSAVITATAQDGSGVKGSFTIIVEQIKNNVHEYVDLGLSVKWATCNVGATSPEDYGDYFAWGETTGYESGKIDFSNTTYKWFQSASTLEDYRYIKYVMKSDAYNYGYDGFYDNKPVLDLEDDAAHVNWGGSWRMPTTAEQDELCTKCILEWTEVNGKKGYKVTGPNGNFIFLPTAGYHYYGKFVDAGYRGEYWSSSLYESGSSDALKLSFASDQIRSGSYYYRFGGLSVRAVCP